MDEQRQREIAAGLLAGRAEAWQALYNDYGEAVWRSVARLVGPTSADLETVVAGHAFVRVDTGFIAYDIRSLGTSAFEGFVRGNFSRPALSADGMRPFLRRVHRVSKSWT